MKLALFFFAFFFTFP
ncbi:pheA operon leader peptide PheL [Pantoea sp. AS142]